MKENEIFFKGIGSYDVESGHATYNVVMPKLEGISFEFDTEDVRKVTWEGKHCLMIYTQNGRDDDNYGTTPEIVQIHFTVPNVEEFGGKDIIVLIKHDTERSTDASKNIVVTTGKPGRIGDGIIKP